MKILHWVLSIQGRTGATLVVVVLTLTFLGESTAPLLAQTNCTSPPAGLVAWWPAENGFSDVMNVNQPSATNAISFVSGKVGNGVKFGANGYVDVPHSASLANQQFTWEGWVRPDGPGPNNDAYGSIVIGKGVTSTFAYSLNWIALSGKFLFVCGDITTATITSSNTFSAGQFYHVAGTYDGNTFKLFVNGALEAQLQLQSTLIYDQTAWSIGSTVASIRNGGYPRTWNGVIDELSIYSRPLSTTEIQAIYQAGSFGKCSIAPTVTTIVSTTLANAGSTNSIALDNFTITASRNFLASSVTNSANYSLHEAGADGIFGSGDDVIYGLTPTLSSGATVSFIVNNGPPQPGNYRFQTSTNLLDLNTNVVIAFTRDFTISNPILGKIENTSNNTLPEATDLPLTESPPGSGFFTAMGVGTFSSTGDVDY